MRLIDYVKDKIFILLINILVLIIEILLMILFSVNNFLIISLTIIYILSFLACFFYSFIKRKKFYDNFYNKLNSLDKKYLITELISSTNFIEGKNMIDILYEINKSFMEEVNIYKYSSEEFKEYIELWCHEIKTPIATSKLIIDNNKNDTTNSIKEEVEKVESFVEQVLFYARSKNVEKDYIIVKTNLKDVVNNVIKRNKKVLIGKNIKVNTFDSNVYVESDQKWLEFIVNQIIINSIKYSKNIKPIINIDCKSNKNNITLFIKDNGIGIMSSELNKVFDKGFTGSNGRKTYNSTGIGLYLCKKLCDKLGIKIEINSEYNKYTELVITFPNNSLTMKNLTNM